MNLEHQGIGFQALLDELAKDQPAPRGQSRARLWVQDLGCQAGDAAACRAAGSTWASQGKRDVATKYYEQGRVLDAPLEDRRAGAACDAGFGQSCDLTGAPPEALVRACVLGNPNACNRMGASPKQRALACLVLEDCADFVRSNTELADDCKLTLNTLVCERESVQACRVVAEAYRTGRGAPRDLDRAFDFMVLATQRWPTSSPQGMAGQQLNADAVRELARDLEQGNGMPQDKHKAAWVLARLCATQHQGCDEVERILNVPIEPLKGELACSVLPPGAWCPGGKCARRGVGKNVVAACEKKPSSG